MLVRVSLLNRLRTQLGLVNKSGVSVIAPEDEEDEGGSVEGSSEEEEEEELSPEPSSTKKIKGS